MRILAAQINPTIADLSHNTDLILKAIQRGQKSAVDIVLLPELALSGYPPEDFLLLAPFMDAVESKLERIIEASKNICVIVGLPRRNPHQQEKILHNSAAVIHDQKLLGYVDKILLPTYDVFDERRYFEPGRRVQVWEINEHKIGITICEDLWGHSALVPATHYLRDPVLEMKDLHPHIVLNLSASPYSFSKFKIRSQVFLKAAQSLQCPIVLCNQVGGNDSLIFDGNSLYIDPRGILNCAKSFESVDLLIDTNQVITPISTEKNTVAELFEALVLGLKDYFRKQGFHKACLGLSGGIDSALVACIAAEALGADNVLALYMPSRFSLSESGHDAKMLAEKLGIHYQEKSIETSFKTYLDLFAGDFAGKASDTTEENLQSRIRGMILMAFSNKFGYIVLNTGNKSEMALGYATLYGDMCGGLGVINDVTKKQVYELARWINREKEVIPSFTIERPPSAELRPDQKDTDSLPDYAIVDQVLQAYVEDYQSPEWIANQYSYPLETVNDLVRRIHQNEYKRRQAPPGLRVSEKAFSVGRRFPIVQKWV